MQKQAPFFKIIHKMFVKKFDLIKIREKVEVEDYISLYIFCNIVSYKKIFIFFSFFSCVTIIRMTI